MAVLDHRGCAGAASAARIATGSRGEPPDPRQWPRHWPVDAKPAEPASVRTRRSGQVHLASPARITRPHWADRDVVGLPRKTQRLGDFCNQNGGNVNKIRHILSRKILSSFRLVGIFADGPTTYIHRSPILRPLVEFRVFLNPFNDLICGIDKTYFVTLACETVTITSPRGLNVFRLMPRGRATLDPYQEAANDWSADRLPPGPAVLSIFILSMLSWMPIAVCLIAVLSR